VGRRPQLHAAHADHRKALKWLKDHDVAHRSVHIVDEPPGKALLKRALDGGLPLKALFNTSGESYRSGGFKERLPEMSQTEALAALAADGKLIKRPFLVGDDVVLVGFKEDDWSAALER
jgi:arsenate reductase (glutaredoxin)